MKNLMMFGLSVLLLPHGPSIKRMRLSKELQSLEVATLHLFRHNTWSYSGVF